MYLMSLMNRVLPASIRRLAFSAVLIGTLTSGLAGTLSAVHAQVAPPPLKSDKYVADTSIISGDPCAAPCFDKITIGQTTLADALTALKADTRFGNVQNTGSQVAWTTAGGDPAGQLLVNAAGVVDIMQIRIAPKVTLKQIVDKFGNPDYVLPQDYSATEVAFGVIYEKLGLVMVAALDGQTDSVKAENPIVLLEYFVPAELSKNIANTPLNGWTGFQPYSVYKAATPVHTPPPPPTAIPQPTAIAAANDLQSPCYGAVAPTTAPPANAPKQWSAAPPMTIDPTHTYCAFLTTAHGVIVVELYAKSAPQHVNSFVFLASQGFFDGITWHRVIAGFVAQTGDPTATGTGGPGYTIPLEVDPALKYDKPGLLGMARTNDPNSAGSQFFITYAPLPNLDAGNGSAGYTIFGRVVRGMEVVNQISPRDQGQPPGDALISVRTVDASAK
jgi:peptidylprolyl isomerase